MGRYYGIGLLQRLTVWNTGGILWKDRSVSATCQKTEKSGNLDFYKTWANVTESSEYNFFTSDINNNCKKTITVELQSFNGQFGYQFLAQAIPVVILAYFSKRSVIFDTTFFISGRWCTIFESFTTCDHPPSTSDQVYISDIPIKSIWNMEFFLKATENITHLRYNTFLGKSQVLSPRKIVSEHLNNNKLLLETYKKIVPVFWRPQQELIRTIISEKEKINGEYIGMHIRWGDKYTETTLLPVDEYITILHTATHNTRIRKIFLMSDDYSAYETLSARLPDFEIFTLIPENSHGNFQYSFVFFACS